jgi:branched-chain amino acid transport system permease protein
LFAIKEGELAAESMGIETAKVKMAAFILSAIYAGVAGALYGPLNSVISPDVFSFDVSVVVLVSLLLGGAGTIVGSIVGTILVTLLPEWLRVLQDYYMVVYGAGIVLLMIFLPTGLLGAARALASRWVAKPADSAT